MALGEASASPASSRGSILVSMNSERSLGSARRREVREVRFGDSKADEDLPSSTPSNQTFRSLGQRGGTPAVGRESDYMERVLNRSMTAYSEPSQGSEPDDSYISLLLHAYGLRDESAKPPPKELVNGTGIRSICYRVSQHWLFRGLFSVLILLNVVSVAVQAESKARQAEDPDDAAAYAWDRYLEFTEHFFTAAFVIEIAIRMIGCPIKPWYDGWLMSDGFLIGLGVLDTWVLRAVEGLSSFGAFRAFRFLRALRAFRVIRFFRHVRPLRLIAEALSEAFQHITWIFVITMVATWAVSVLFTGSISVVVPDAPGGLVEVEGMLGSFDETLMLMNLVLLRGIQWGPRLMSPLLFSGDVQCVFVGVIFLIFVLVVIVGFLNLIAGVFINSLLEAAQRDTVFMQRKSLTTGEVSLQKLKEAFEKFDVKGRGVLTAKDLEQGLVDNPEFCETIGLRSGQAEALFRQLDGNRNEGVNLDEFLVGLVKLTWTSKSVDMLCMDYMQLRSFRSLHMIAQIYDRDLALINQSFIDSDRCLVKLHIALQELVEHLSRGQASAEEDAAGTEEPTTRDRVESVAQELESRFSFRTRFEKLRASLGKAAATEPAADRGGGAGLRGPGPGPEDEGKLRKAWQEVLFEEALPWLQERLAAIAAARPGEGPEPEGGRAAAGAGVEAPAAAARATPANEEALAPAVPAAAPPQGAQQQHWSAWSWASRPSVLGRIDRASPLYARPAPSLLRRIDRASPLYSQSP